MQNINHKLLIYFLLLFLLINSALAFYEGPELNTENDTNPIPELYEEVSPEYMENVIGNITSILDNYVFIDILKNPPNPYGDSKVDIINELYNISTNESKPFYEFYREIKMALSLSHDSILDFVGGEIPFENGSVSFSDYRMCLPFKFCLDYDKNSTEVKMFIKEYPSCSGDYNESVRDFIKNHEKEPLAEINGQDPFSFVHNFGKEIYKFKNPDGQFNIIIDSIHDNYLTFTPISIEQLNYIELNFYNNDTFNTSFKVIKTPIEANKKHKEINKDQSVSDIPWNFQSDGGEIKCRVDEVNNLNILFIKTFYVETVENKEDLTIYKCAKLFYSNDFKIAIITSQLWETDNEMAYIFAQLLFPKIDVKFNMAMRQTLFNQKIFAKPDI